MIEVLVLATEEVGDRSYLLHDGETAVVVDPQSDLGELTAILHQRGLRLTHVLDTHVHNDYVSGGLELARSQSAAYVLSRHEPVSFYRYRVGVGDGDVLKAGAMELDVVHTPGHTPHHLSFVARDADGVAGVFTGGSLLYGSVGRTDLLGPGAAENLTRSQFRSARRLFSLLPGHTPVFPTHGFGSFCAAGSAEARPAGSLAQEMENPLFTGDEDTFVETTLATLGGHPRYYAQMGPLNRAGGCGSLDGMKLLEIGEDELREEAAAGATVVDLRPRQQFAASHLPGSLNFEWTTSFVGYLGWILPFGVPLILTSQEREALEAAAHALALVGIREVTACVLENDELGEGSYPVSDFAGLAAAVEAGGSLSIVDARERSEWEAGHLRRALHAPYHSVEAAAALLSRNEQVWVHCGLGYRAAVAASVLDRLGFHPVLIDDTFEAVVNTSLALEGG